MSMVGFPLLLIPLAIYNIIVFLMPDVSFAEPLFNLTADVGHRVAGDAERHPACARDPAVAAARSSRARVPARNISPIICCRWSCSAARPRNSCCGRNSAPRPISCWRCWRWWISCRVLRCVPGAECRWRRPPRSQGAASESPPTSRRRTGSTRSRAGAAPAAAARSESVLQDHPEPTLAHPGVEAASNASSATGAVAGTAAGRRLAPLAGRARRTERQMICRARMPAPWTRCWLAL